MPGPTASPTSTLHSSGFDEILRAAGAALFTDSGGADYTPVLHEGRDALIVNRVLRDGSAWTAVAGIPPGRSVVRVRFITGRARRYGLLEVPITGEAVQLEDMRPLISKLVEYAPRRLARRLAYDGVVLDRLIRRAWRGGHAIRLTQREYYHLEAYMIAADGNAAPRDTRRLRRAGRPPSETPDRNRL